MVDEAELLDLAVRPNLALVGSPSPLPQLSVLVAEGLPLVRALLRDLLPPGRG